MRWTDGAPAAALRSLAAPAAGGPDAPPNLSVLVGGRRDGARDKHLLYVQGRLLAAPTTDASLLRSVVRAGAGLVTGAVAAAAGAVVLDAVPVVAPDGAVTLVDRHLDAELRLVRSRLERTGHRVVDTPRTIVEPDPPRVRVPDALAAWRIDRAALDARLPPGPADDDLGPVDAPITGLVLAVVATPTSAAGALAAAASLARDEQGRLRTADVERLGMLLRRVELTPYRVDQATDARELLEVVGASRGT